MGDEEKMKAITILQPWASLIACGTKRIETRGWATKYRGPIAIHAGKSMKYEELCTDEPFYSAMVNKVKFYSHGSVIAIADLIDCQKVVGVSSLRIGPVEQSKAILGNDSIVTGNELSFGDFTPGRYAWIFNNVRPINPVPAKGQQRLWKWVPPEGGFFGV